MIREPHGGMARCRHCYPLAIALVTIVLGSVTSHILGRSEPAWVRAGGIP